MGALAEHGQLLRDVTDVPPTEAFLIGDILASTITVISGEPKVGKSLLVAGMISALLDGADDFVGFPVYRRLPLVAYGCTDPGADGELKARIPQSLAGRIWTFPANDASEDFWLGLADDMRRASAAGDPYGLLVLDNVLGSLAVGDNIAEAKLASDYMRRVNLVADSGVPVLLVSHTPKGNREGLTTAASPTGGSAFAAGARVVEVLRKSGQNGLRLLVASNRGAELEVPLDVLHESEGSEVPRWIRRTHRAQKRTSETDHKTTAAIDAILAKQPGKMSERALAQWAAAEVDMSHNTLKPKLKTLVQFDDRAQAYVRLEAGADS